MKKNNKEDSQRLSDPPSTEKVEEAEPSPFITIVGWAVISLFFILLLLTTSPFGAFLGTSEWAVVSALHGMLATLGVVIVTVVGYLGWRLYIGQLRAYSDLRILSILTVLVSAATIIFGNWVYIAYRSPGGPRAYFLANNPAIHEVFFEFKEFIALFTLPLAIVAAYSLWTYRDSLPQNKQLRTTITIVIVMTWTIFMVTYILGAAVTKLRSV